LINISKLILADKVSYPGDGLRFPKDDATPPPPVIVWHLTGDCNLSCAHCYAAEEGRDAARGMETREAHRFIDKLSELRPPSLLLSGGEPTMHPYFFDYLSLARARGLNVSISTNGTLIDEGTAARMKTVGVSYVGVSLDGPAFAHDEFRGMRGAFSAAVRGIDTLARGNCRVGLRVTLARPTLPHLDCVFDLAESLPVRRVCFYHLIPSGRGAKNPSLMPAADEESDAVGRIIEWAHKLCSRTTRGGAAPLEILTVGDSSDGVRLCEYLSSVDRDAAYKAYLLLKRAVSAGGRRRILSVRWDGTVFPDQFSWDKPLGPWTDLPFDSAPPPARACPPCGYDPICNGSMRARAGYDCPLWRKPLEDGTG
jgi:MoaA/NifB/PqqE/SkfB family radical SAM enzyme